jgi:hypothetical protein
MKSLFYFLILIITTTTCNQKKQPDTSSTDLKAQIQNNEGFAFVKKKALDIVKTGFNAGDGYGEVWIRDYNTFI